MKRLSVEFKFIPRQATLKHLKDKPPGLLPVIPRSLVSGPSFRSFLARTHARTLSPCLARTHAFRHTVSLVSHARTHADTLSPCLARMQTYCLPVSHAHASTHADTLSPCLAHMR